MTIADELVTRPARFIVGKHTVDVAKIAQVWRWSVSVDEKRLESSYESQAEAWEAGVREADRLDQISG
jgi:hypothetical protein